MLDWPRKKSVIFAVRVLNFEKKLFRMYYGKQGDLFLQPLIRSAGGAVVTTAEPSFVTGEQIRDGMKFDGDALAAHGYISFHVSGVVKGPDFQSRSEGYEKGNHSIRSLKTLVEVCEQRPADPGAYPDIDEQDRNKKNIIFISSAPAAGLYPVIKLEFFPENYLRDFNSPYKDYVAGLSAIDMNEKDRFIALVRVEYIKGEIPSHHQVLFKRSKLVQVREATKRDA